MSDNKEVTCPRLRLWKYPHMAKVLKCSSLVVLMESWNNCRKLGSPAKPCVCTLRSLLPEPTLYHSYMEGCSHSQRRHSVRDAKFWDDFPASCPCFFLPASLSVRDARFLANFPASCLCYLSSEPLSFRDARFLADFPASCLCYLSSEPLSFRDAKFWDDFLASWHRL